ncbi:MAG: glycosyltransferase [Lachnospiraceae bacterium]|nr:glycosyltransferase [Lachnospiraceae bacterium]
MLEKYMDLIDYSPSSHFHTKPYLIFNCIGIPVDIKEKVRIDKKNVDKVRILHAPSDQKAKGTAIVRNIVKEMQEEGYDFEYMEVSGLPHRVVLEKMAMSDIVVDQVYSDTPMAGFATEAAINGVPVVVGGYYAEVYKKVLPDPIAPTVYCNPEELKEKIIYLIEHEEERIRIGEKERAYVEGHCLAETVANKFLRIFDRSYPKEWIMNPSDNDYIWGYGESRETVANEITRLIDRYGTEALCLDKNGVLYKKYVQLYNDTKAGNRVKEGI